MPKTVTIEVGRQERFLTVTREAVDQESRTVALSFSSEEAVERWYGMEILGHGPGECDLTRLQDGAPFLMDHKWGDQRGVIESAQVTGGKGQATVRMSKSDRGEELLTDMVDGIRTKVSVGYEVLELIHVRRDESGMDWYRATKWRPYEISSVSVPADNSVGVGRSKPEHQENPITITVELREDAMPNPNTPDTQDQTRDKQAPEQNNNQGGPTADQERERVTEILVIGRQFGMEKQAEDAIKNGVSLARFKDDVLAQVRDGGIKPAGTDMSLDLSDKELRRYSLVNAIRAAGSGNWKNAGLEREISVALAEKMGKDARGFYVNYQVLSGLGQRDALQSKGNAANGGNLVDTELWSNEFIDLLRPASMAASLGVRFATGLVGDVDIPKMLSGASFYWVDEDGAPNNSAGTFGIVKMSPKTIAGAVPMTRRLLQQSTPDIDLLMRNDILTGVGLALDRAIYFGSGTNNEPRGIANQTGVNAIPVAAWDWKTLVDFETQVAEANASAATMAYLSRPSLRGLLKTTPVVAGQAVFLHNKGEVNDYKHLISTQAPADTMLFGDHSQALCGLWGALDLKVDTAAKAASGGVVLRVFQDADVCVRHPQAFALGKKAA